MTEKSEGGRPLNNQSVAATSYAPTLADMGITKDQSSNWQTLAAMSDEHFEATVETAKDTSGELAENEFRKDFTPSERVAIGEAIEAQLQGRQLATLKQNSVPENLPERGKPQGDTRDLVAKATGFGKG